MFNKKQQPQLERYEDVTGEFTSGELKWGEWYVRHKILLRKISIGLLSAWCVVTLGYGLGYFIYYFSYGYFQDQQMASQQLLELSNLKNTRALFQAKELQVGRVEMYNSVSEETYDFVARVSNPNDRWIAIVNYKFSFSGGETDTLKTIILPQSQRPLAYFGFESTGYPTGVKLLIENVKWKNINIHSIPDVAGFIADRANFPVENFQFIRASASQGIPSNMIEFDMLNDTAYNFWEPSFYIELINQNRTVGLIYFVASEFRSQEIRSVDLRSYVNNLEVSDIKVWPVLNVFDSGQYMPVSIL